MMVLQGQQVMDQQVADSLAQQAYVNQAVFPLHTFPHNVQQDITNALNSGNNELAQAEIQRFMQYAQVRQTLGRLITIAGGVQGSPNKQS